MSQREPGTDPAQAAPLSRVPCSHVQEPGKAAHYPTESLEKGLLKQLLPSPLLRMLHFRPLGFLLIFQLLSFKSLGESHLPDITA